MTFCDTNCTHILINVNVTCWVNASQCQTPIDVTNRWNITCAWKDGFTQVVVSIL